MAGLPGARWEGLGGKFPMGGLWDELGAQQHRDCVNGAYDHVARLNSLRLVVCIGKGTRVRRSPTGPFEWTTVYVPAWPNGEEKKFLAVEKSA